MKFFTFLLFFVAYNSCICQAIFLKDYSIYPNNLSDASISINKLILEVKSDTVEIYFDKGKYILDNPLKINKPVKLILTNETTLEVNNVIGGIFVSVNNFSMKGGKIICKPSDLTEYKGFGILLHGVDSCQIKNLEITEFSSSGIILAPRGNKGCNYNLISENTLSSNQISSLKFINKSGIMLGYSGTGYSHDHNRIENNTIKGNFTIHHGISLIGHGKSNLIKNNIISSCVSYGIVIYESISNMEEYTIIGSEIIGNKISNIGNVSFGDNLKGMGIYLMKTSSSFVKDNIIENVLLKNDPLEALPPGAIAIHTSINCNIKNNTIKNSEKYGVMAVYSKNLVIASNQISSTKLQPIYISYSNFVEITSNMLFSKGKEIIKVKYGNTCEVGLPEYAFKKGFYELETGLGINIESNTIKIKKNKNAILLVQPINSNSSVNITFIKNVLDMKGKIVIPNDNIKGRITIKDNKFN